MAYTRTMQQLIGLCQRRADKESDPHVDTDEWKELISEVYGELHAVVADTGARYFESEATITATGASSYALPSDHLSTVGVDYVVNSAGERRSLDQLMVQERQIFSGRTGEARWFAFTGTNVALYPTPSTGTYKHIYVPQPTDYSSVGNGTSIDVINVHGLKFITWGVASIVLHKGDENQQRALAEREAAKEALTEWAVKRALTMPKRRIVTETDIHEWERTGFISPGDWRYRP